MQLLKILFLVIFAILNSSIAQNNYEVFNEEEWDLSAAKKTEYLGRESIVGIAVLKDTEFENGIIEVDIATVEGKKSYPGVLFRMQSMGDYERLYIRPHRSIFYEDAVQYVSSNNGIDSWQLFSGPGKSSSAEIPNGKWNHLKIEVSGSQAKVYLNDMRNPILHITELGHKISRGGIGLFGPTDGSAYFSNFSYKQTNGFQVESSIPKEKMYGIIEDWKISTPFASINADLENYPSMENLSNLKWNAVKSDETGLVDISKYFPRHYRYGDCIYAKAIIDSPIDSTLLLNFGYSDYVTIFLNGKPVFFGNSAYQSRDKSFLGIVGYYDYIFFPLKKGKNEIMILVAETFGGWGFMFRNSNAIFTNSTLTQNWLIKGEITSPETIVYDKENKCCYISSYFNEGKEYIAKISIEGKIIEKEWIRGLNMPSGMCINDGKLYIVDRKNLNIVDIAKGIIVEKIQLEGMIYPNDITTDGKGAFYISDSRSNSISLYENKEIKNWLKDDLIGNVNGLFFDKEYLYAGIGIDGKVKRISLRNKEISDVFDFGTGSRIDGIAKIDNENFLISDYNGFLYKASINGEKEILINSKTPGQSIANFEYIPETKQIIIPTVFSNKILSYLIK